MRDNDAKRFRDGNPGRDAITALRAKEGVELGYATIFPDEPYGHDRQEAEAARFPDGSILILQGAKLEEAKVVTSDGRLPLADVTFTKL